MANSLISLIYCSKATQDLSDDAAVLASVLDVAAKNNKKLGVTGAMTVADGYVLQCLEGDRDAVSRLYNSIVQDQRHEDCVLLDLRRIGRRLYAEWGMAGVPAEFVAKFAHSAGGGFNPYKFGPDEAFEFMVEASSPDILAG